MKLTLHSCLCVWQLQLVKQCSSIVMEILDVISDVLSQFILITSLHFLITVLFLLYRKIEPQYIVMLIGNMSIIQAKN